MCSAFVPDTTRVSTHAFKYCGVLPKILYELSAPNLSCSRIQESFPDPIA